MSRVVIWRLGLPPPELQFEVIINGEVYRTDFAWPEHRVLGEFDGKVKYGDVLRPGETAADAVMREVAKVLVDFPQTLDERFIAAKVPIVRFRGVHMDMEAEYVIH